LLLTWLNILAGICIYAGIFHFFVSLRRPVDKGQLFFAISCFTICIYDLIGIKLYGTSDPDVYLKLFKLQVTVSYLAGLFCIWFVAFYTDVKYWSLLAFISICTVALVIANTIYPTGIIYSEISAVKAHMLPWGEAVMLPVVTLHTLQPLTGLVGLLGHAYFVIAVYKSYKNGNKRTSVLIGLGVAFVIAASIHAGFVDSGIISSIYLIEAAFLAFVILMSLDLSWQLLKTIRMEHQLSRSENRLHLVTENVSDVVWSADSDLKITHISSSISGLLGYDKEEVLNKNLEEFYSPESFENFLAAFASQEKFSKETDNLIPITIKPIELKMRRKDKTEIVTELIASIMRDDKEAYPLYYGVIRDITERKKIETEQQKTQKIESIGVLAGGIAHDFNNILTTLWGNISMASMGVEPAGETAALLTESQKALKRAQDLTRQLLTFSKGGVLLTEHSSVTDIIKNSIAFSLRGSKTKCDLSIAEGTLYLNVDKGQINQVMNNLIINADQAMPDGGLIQISAYNVVLSSENSKKALLLPDGEYVKISIQDQGLGISKENMPKIFDPYFTTKENGSGLGLATSYSIVKNHGGLLCANSRLEKGSVFDIYLPAADDPDFQEKKAFNIKKLIGKSSGNILMMDDDKQLKTIAGKMLRKLGYHVEFTSEGNETVTKYKNDMEIGVKYDLVILDLTIPGGFGGKKTIRKLQKIDPDVKAIVSSGYSNDPVMANPAKYGFSGRISKPYTIESLAKSLDIIL
jgi:PAS domain S-box-containing protein